MKTFKVTVREINSVEYSIEADTEQEARDLFCINDQRIVNEHVVDWDIIEIEEYNYKCDGLFDVRRKDISKIISDDEEEEDES